jgi:hypothetical protein
LRATLERASRNEASRNGWLTHPARGDHGDGAWCSCGGDLEQPSGTRFVSGPVNARASCALPWSTWPGRSPG